MGFKDDLGDEHDGATAAFAVRSTARRRNRQKRMPEFLRSSSGRVAEGSAEDGRAAIGAIARLVGTRCEGDRGGRMWFFEESVQSWLRERDG